MTAPAPQSRVDALIRLIGLVVLAFGGMLLYLTATDATASNVAGAIVTINYALGILLVIVGLFAAFAKFK